MSHREDGRPYPVRTAELAHFTLLPLVELEIEQVYGLPDYARYQAGLDEALALKRLAIDEIASSARLSSLDAFVRRFAESSRALRESGLPGCAAGATTIARQAEGAGARA